MKTELSISGWCEFHCRCRKRIFRGRIKAEVGLIKIVVRDKHEEMSFAAVLRCERFVAVIAKILLTT
jgi:hypothetical protein